MSSSTSLMINRTVTSNAKQNAKHFSKLFAGIAGEFNPRTVKPKNTHFSFRKKANNDSLFLTPVTAEE